MDCPRLSRFLFAALLALALPAFAIDSAFTYQGHLTDQGQPASGAYDLRFTLQNAGGGTIGAPVVLDDVSVAGGVFTVQLDFGAVAFDGDDRFLAIAVRRGDQTGGFQELSPRTAITPAPYAQVSAAAEIAATVPDGSIGATQVDSAQVQRRVTGTCAAGQSIRVISPTGAVTCEPDDDTGITAVNAGIGLTSSIAGRTLTLNTDANLQRRTAANSLSCPEGQYLRAVSASGASTCVADGVGWALGGNAGTNPENDFIGTTDAQPLVLRARNTPVARYEASDVLRDGVPITANVIAGSSANFVTLGVRGATIGGGGVPDGYMEPETFAEGSNKVTDAYGTVGGGTGNRAGNASGSTIDAMFATVGGGQENTASGFRSTVGGGAFNQATARSSTVGGGDVNFATADVATIGGGVFNGAGGVASTVAGGENNCAGGNYTWAGGRNAKARPASGVGQSFGCNGIPTTGTAGDQGTFVWADSAEENFISTGPNQFLVRADGGAVFQKRISTETNARRPRGFFNVVMADSGTPQPDTPSGDTVAAFERNGPAFIRIFAPVANARGLLFSDSDNISKGGVVYDGASNSLQLRTNGNTTRMRIGDDGSLSLRRGNTVPDADKAIQVGTNTSNGNGAHLTNAGVWTSASSRHFKHAFEAIDPQAVLERLVELPIARWRYLGDDAVQHLGPVAEDFRAAFGLGHDERYIGGVDADGVALAAIQGLNTKLEAQIAAQSTEIATLREELTALRALLIAGER